MKENSLKFHALEASKVTFFCLIITVFFGIFGCSDHALLVAFYMAVMCAMSTFSIHTRHFNQVVLGGGVIGLSIISGGLLGYYIPVISKLIAILYAGLSLAIPKIQYQIKIFTTGCITYLVFTTIPFPVEEGLQYFMECVFVFFFFLVFYFIFDYKKTRKIVFEIHKKETKKITAWIAVLSLSMAWMISSWMSLHYHYPKIYWMELTALVVVIGSKQDTISRCIKRILACTASALIVLILFEEILPQIFWINFSILTLFLFFIFFFNFTYLLQVLFIELFVFSFTFLLSDKDPSLALARIGFTVMGGAIVVVATIIIQHIFKIGGQKNAN